MNIRQLYKKYDIMPQLAEHQLRVGGIIKLISDDKDAILTGLVHDMGNLAKFALVDKEWIDKQKIFHGKYGTDAHLATRKILEQSGLIKLRDYIEEESKLYDKAMDIDNFGLYSKPAVLTLYADSRVAIDGVTTLMGRITDLETRYKTKRDDRIWAPKLEEHVQTLCEIDVKSITENDVRPLFEELLSYNV